MTFMTKTYMKAELLYKEIWNINTDFFLLATNLRNSILETRIPVIIAISLFSLGFFLRALACLYLDE